MVELSRGSDSVEAVARSGCNPVHTARTVQGHPDTRWPRIERSRCTGQTRGPPPRPNVSPAAVGDLSLDLAADPGRSAKSNETASPRTFGAFPVWLTMVVEYLGRGCVGLASVRVMRVVRFARSTDQVQDEGTRRKRMAASTRGRTWRQPAGRATCASATARRRRPA